LIPVTTHGADALSTSVEVKVKVKVRAKAKAKAELKLKLWMFIAQSRAVHAIHRATSQWLVSEAAKPKNSLSMVDVNGGCSCTAVESGGVHIEQSLLIVIDGMRCSVYPGGAGLN
jgi:hypothetical protein